MTFRGAISDCKAVAKLWLCLPNKLIELIELIQKFDALV